MSIEAMKQALDALDMACAKYGDVGNIHTDWGKWDAAGTALRKELAKPEQEPVAWMVRDQVDGCRYPSALKNPAGSINGESQPLYTAPPRKEWVGLNWDDIPDVFVGDIAFMQGAKWALAKLKEKNGG